MVKRVVRFDSGVRSKVRMPLRSPSGIPPLQVMRGPGVELLDLDRVAAAGIELADQVPGGVASPAAAEGGGLVDNRAEGTRRRYRLRDEGIEAVCSYLEQVWGDAAARFRIAAENLERR
jgi:hypothetical protein